MLAGALKTIMLTSFGDYFKSHKQLVEFEEAYDTVSVIDWFDRLKLISIVKSNRLVNKMKRRNPLTKSQTFEKGYLKFKILAYFILVYIL